MKCKLHKYLRSSLWEHKVLSISFLLFFSLDLHHEIEDLRAKLKESQSRMAQMERDYCHSRDYAEQEISKLQDELAKLRDRYDRLFESHKKMQRVNHNLEDKLLTIVSAT